MGNSDDDDSGGGVDGDDDNDGGGDDGGGDDNGVGDACDDENIEQASLWIITMMKRDNDEKQTALMMTSRHRDWKVNGFAAFSETGPQGGTWGRPSH